MAQAVGEYLESKCASQAIREELEALETVPKDSKECNGKQWIRARTARRWLRKLGFSFSEVKKDVYVDGHERPDVVEYRNDFLQRWATLKKKFAIFAEDGTWQRPQIPEDERPIILVTHDESIFNANDGKRRLWIENGNQPLRPKGKGKGIMVSGYLTPGGILRVPENISDSELLEDSEWPRQPNGQPIREAMEYLEFGKDHYWTGDKMVDQAINVALPIFNRAFPGCTALFAFDNAANHCSFAPDALIATKMNLGPGGKQPIMRDGWDEKLGVPQRMIFPADYPDARLRGQPKGIKQVLLERGLWRDQNSDGTKFRLSCPKGSGATGCDPEKMGNCCAVRLLQSQPDFQNQRGRLEEEINRSGHLVIFYPKFHCELNFIERFWCSAKRYARDNCTYGLAGLRETVPKAISSIPTATINRYYNRCERIIEAYRSGCKIGTQEFKDRVYSSHRRVEDNSTW